MKIWKQVVLATVAILALGASANLVATAAGSNDPAGVVDTSGPCDEAEHANDPRCAGAAVTTAQPTPEPTATPTENPLGVDISGPCDEPEHANDPRCTGAGPKDDNHRGPGDGGDDDNSGRSDNSGPGGGDDDDDDNSGPGGGDD